MKIDEVEVDGPMVRDQDVPLLKKGAKARGEVDRELGTEGHRKGLRHTVIVESL